MYLEFLHLDKYLAVLCFCHKKALFAVLFYSAGYKEGFDSPPVPALK